ncbi:hypothetical protein [Flavivirga algicola]|uniref:Uncharacterized protein n=1 Tax=Flavivirga algicola TaxID=2729136 RepID=A0ABX1S549_9FLAO|nr:hypothetical protein [Flavivirga algicola]NMH89973.1 hypothetical protein [Flavivirga algicola]
MTQLKFHSPEFEFEGISIPEFDVEYGKLIRLCIPNFDSMGNSLVHRFRYGLLNRFEEKIPKAKWSKEYKESIFRKSLKPLTVENYITKKLNIDKTKAKDIAEYLELNPNEKVRDLILGKSKALAIKCDFEKYDTLVFDYFGVGAMDFEFLEKIVDFEIKRGKRGVTIDRLEYNQDEEKNENIEQLKITVGNNV